MIRCCPGNITEYYCNFIIFTHNFFERLAVVWISKSFCYCKALIFNTINPLGFNNIYMIIIR